MKTTVLFENEFCIVLNVDSKFLRVDKILLTCMCADNYFNKAGEMVKL